MNAGAAVPTAGWGRYPIVDCVRGRPSCAEEAAAVVSTARSLIARGCGRSYGDSSLNTELTLETLCVDRLLDFDPVSGMLVCESGVRLSDLIALFVPRGWFPPVTPGTRFVTVGGMIAADVHGKNHHGAGSFCDHVEWIDLALGEGRIERCSREVRPELFAAACGGMGLAGVILRAAFRMKPVETAHIRQRTMRAANLDEAMRLFENSADWTYSVAWIDCLARGGDLGRSVLFLGEHAGMPELPSAARATPLALPAGRKLRLPVDAPRFVLGSTSVRLFNRLYFKVHRPSEELVDLDTYFYPLDRILDWNRIYGRRGFVQYQCVLPLETSREGLAAMLAEISTAGVGSFLAVLKRMGGQSFGFLSFPRPGYTLALDFPVSADTFALLQRLDRIMMDNGGRLYLAKDARSGPVPAQAGYPRLDAFREVRRRWRLDDRFESLQSRRLGL